MWPSGCPRLCCPGVAAMSAPCACNYPHCPCTSHHHTPPQQETSHLAPPFSLLLQELRAIAQSRTGSSSLLESFQGTSSSSGKADRGIRARLAAAATNAPPPAAAPAKPAFSAGASSTAAAAAAGGAAGGGGGGGGLAAAGALVLVAAAAAGAGGGGSSSSSKKVGICGMWSAKLSPAGACQPQ
jgi:hypothetical protein